MRDLGLLGGTFDPPHAAHLAMARAALGSGLVDEIVVIPAGDPWQKQPGTPAAHRLAMTRLAFDSEPYCVVDDLEVRRPGPSYACDTVSTLSSPHVRLHYIIGSDTLALLPTWHRVAELVQGCDFLVIKRPGSLVTPPDLPGLRLQVVGAPETDVSSTSIRDAIRQGLRPEPLASAVWDYITDHALYGLPHD